MEYYEKIAKQEENKFLQPKLLQQTIRYTTNKIAADIVVSSKHTLGDYLLLGVVALRNSLEGKSGSILVYNEETPESEMIGIATDSNVPFKPVRVYSRLFLQSIEPINEIHQLLYLGNRWITGIGINLSMILFVEFSDSDHPGAGIPKAIMDELDFSNFDDLEAAQKNAYVFIKKMTGAIVAGTIYAIKNGED